MGSEDHAVFPIAQEQAVVPGGNAKTLPLRFITDTVHDIFTDSGIIFSDAIIRDLIHGITIIQPQGLFYDRNRCRVQWANNDFRFKLIFYPE